MQRVIDAMIVRGIIPKEDEAVYRFGLECLLLKSCYMASFFAVSLWMGKPGEFVFFSLLYFFLRSSAGGFHAKTRLNCYFLSLLQVVITLILTDRVTVMQQTQFVSAYGCLFLLGCVAQAVIWLLAPVDNPNKALDEVETCHYRRQTRKKLLVFDALFIVSFFFQLHTAAVLVLLCQIESAVLLLIQQGRNRRAVCGDPVGR